jgi:WD40 repeat protein
LSVALSPDGKWVMSGSKDRGVQFWDPETGDAQLMLQGHKNSGESLLMIFTFIFLIASMSFSC